MLYNVHYHSPLATNRTTLFVASSLMGRKYFTRHCLPSALSSPTVLSGCIDGHRIVSVSHLHSTSRLRFTSPRSMSMILNLTSLSSSSVLYSPNTCNLLRASSISRVCKTPWLKLRGRMSSDGIISPLPTYLSNSGMSATPHFRRLFASSLFTSPSP